MSSSSSDSDSEKHSRKSSSSSCSSGNDLIETYEKWAKEYDEDMKKLKYRGAECLMDMLEIYVRDKETKILDVCAGTGAIGRALKEHGFDNIDGHDGSEEMLKVAQSYGIYRNTYVEKLRSSKSCENIPEQEYDAVVAVGGVEKMHLNFVDLLIQAAKPGGKLFIGFERKFETEEFVEKIASLHSAKKIIPMCRKVYNQYKLIDHERPDEFSKGVFLAIEVC